MSDLAQIQAQQGAMVKKALIDRNQYELQLAEDIARYYADPYGYVMYVFPWGEPGTDLEDQTGPDVWQREQLMRIGKAFRDNPECTIQEAIGSGHGIGKSAEVSWIVHWAMATRPKLAGWVTANTMNQLVRKTWRELSLWNTRALNSHWFEWTATRFQRVGDETEWGIDALPWTEHNSESFAGLHAKHVLMIMDEASGVADKIWEVSEGALTTSRVMWFVYGNPTRNTGRFRECFGRYKHRWVTRNIDSRTCKMTNKEQIEKWKEDHGEDSDFFRVRVRGEFPHHASNQVIGSGTVHEARQLNLPESDYVFAPCHLGVDVARFGDDESVISVRQGRKHVRMEAYRGMDNMQVGAKTAQIFREMQNTGVVMGAIFVDGIGVGSGVVDYLNSMGYPVIDVNVGRAAEQDKIYLNKRAEIWFRLREWLEAGADIIDDPDLADQLTNATYDMVPQKDIIQLETKKSMKARGVQSPDKAESIALTLAEVYNPMVAVGSRDSFEAEEY